VNYAVKVVRSVMLMVGLTVLGIIGYYGYSFYQFGQHIQKSDKESIFQVLERRLEADANDGSIGEVGIVGGQGAGGDSRKTANGRTSVGPGQPGRAGSLDGTGKVASGGAEGKIGGSRVTPLGGSSEGYTASGSSNGSKNSYIPPKWEGRERVNLLLLGGDSRGLKQGEVPRSDSMVVVSIDPVSKRPHLFSILRDTYVSIPGHGKNRINTALAQGGPTLAMETVSELLGIPIQYYVYTDFQGFIALVDAVGGIDIDVEKDMRYSDSEDGPEYDIRLKKGYQHLDGKTALQYVRFRHDALSDYARTERQRKFLKSLAMELQSTSSLLKLPKILSSVHPYIETNMTITQMLKLGALSFDLKTDDMGTQQLPPTNLLKQERIHGASVLTVNKQELRRFVKEQLRPPAEGA
jgi:polyisoprenyl-teichoic acid--peptidoglycan teichoic acid transferase